jgi:hypothetical protein
MSDTPTRAPPRELEQPGSEMDGDELLESLKELASNCELFLVFLL